MAKLQLYIGKSTRGYKSLINIHPEEDVRRYIGDFRSALTSVGYDPSRINIFHLVNYRSRGVLITVIRTIPPGHGDHLAATVFVPDNLRIAGDALTSILDSLANTLKPSEVSAQEMARLRTLFDTDYPVETDTPLRVETDGRDYAFATVGNGHPTFEDYGRDRYYLPSFGSTAGVLLLPADIKCELPDLTPPAIPELMPLNPPETPAHGFTPMIFGRVFNKPFLVARDSEIEIVWRRPGFEDLVQTVKVTDPASAQEMPEAAEARKSISPATFFISAEKSRERLENVEISVNGCLIKGPTPFTLAELEKAQVEISAPGFFTYSSKLDLATTTQALIQMKELRKAYRFDLPVITPEPEDCVHFTIESKKELTECPVEGYAVAGDGKPAEGISRSNTLVYSGTSSGGGITNVIIAAAAGMLCGLLLGWLVFSSPRTPQVPAEPEVEEELYEDTSVTETPVIPEGSGTVRPAPETPAEPAGQPQPTPEPAQEPADARHAEPALAQTAQLPAPDASQPAAAFDAVRARTYLDNHKTWKKAELEAAGLTGLYEDLNEYNFDRLKTFWGPKLEGSRKFSTVLNAIRGAATKGNPRRGTHNPTYNRPDDTAIFVQGYCWHIDP